MAFLNLCGAAAGWCAQDQQNQQKTYQQIPVTLQTVVVTAHV